MIAFFPDPVTEQLLADVFGRYKVLSGCDTTYAVNRDLFGKDIKSINLDFPSSLEKLISALPPNHSYTADDLIDKHTILPYYAPFLPPSRLKEIREIMKTDNGKQISPKVGISAFAIQRPVFLRNCPVCLQKDSDKKFPFFHRIHQLEGVEICLEHGVFLTSTVILTNAQRWVCAEEVISSISEPENADLETDYGVLLFAIAKDSQWLLDHPGISMGPDEILRRYGVILANRGLAAATGVSRQKKIRELIRTFYSTELLKKIGCPLKNNDDWVHKLLCHNTALPPLYHILFLRFLGISLEQFFVQEWKLEPFGNGPWSCFNPVSHSHVYGAQTIKAVEIAINYEPKRTMNRMIGTFTCPCGFSYWLREETQRSKLAPQSRHVLSRGPDWDQELCKAWDDPDVGNYDLRLKFRLQQSDLVIEAKRLNLAVPRKGKSKSTYIPQKRPKPVIALTVDATATSKELEGVRDNMRNEWIQLRTDYPHHNMSKLKALNKTVYNWLYKNDKAWFDENKPPRISHAPNWTKEELQQADTEIAALLPEAAMRLKAANELPKRVTPAAILKAIGKYIFSNYHKANLPITWNAAQQLAETDDEWNERRKAYHLRQG